MKKILFIASHLAVGGAEKILFKQCQILAKHCFDVFVVCTDVFGDIGEKLLSLKFKVEDISKFNKTEKIQCLINLIVSIHPDIVFIHNAYIAPAIQATKNRVKYKLVIENHGCLEFEKRFPRRLLDSFNGYSDLVISPHPKTFELAKSLYNSEHTMILNPIDSKFFTSNYASRKKNIIGFCGRISKEKSLVSLASIAKIVKYKIPDVSVLIVGDADQSCQQYKKDVQNAFIHADVPLKISGFVDNCEEWMQNANVSVMLSVTEGFSNVIWESCALGVPVISTNVGSSYLIANHIIDISWDGSSFELPEHVHQIVAENIAKSIHSLYDQTLLREKAKQTNEKTYSDKFIRTINRMVLLRNRMS